MKIESKNLHSLIFFEQSPLNQLPGYVLGIIYKKLTRQNFNLGIKKVFYSIMKILDLVFDVF